MAIITFTVQTSAGDIVNTITAPQKAKLQQMGGRRRLLQFPYGPQGISYDGIGLNYETVDRPGLAPLLQATSQKQRMLSVVAVLATPQDGGKSSVENQLETLKVIALEDIDCAFTYGVVTVPFRVRLTNYTYTAIQRDLNGNITQAEINLQLDEHVIFSQSVVSLRAIEYPPDPAPDSSSKETTSKTSTSKAPTSKPVDSGSGITHVPPPIEPQ